MVKYPRAPVAQRIEQRVSNPLAVGSIPTGGTIRPVFTLRMAEEQNTLSFFMKSQEAAIENCPDAALSQPSEAARQTSRWQSLFRAMLVAGVLAAGEAGKYAAGQNANAPVEHVPTGEIFRKITDLEKNSHATRADSHKFLIDEGRRIYLKEGRPPSWMPLLTPTVSDDRKSLQIVSEGRAVRVSAEGISRLKDIHTAIGRTAFEVPFVGTTCEEPKAGMSVENALLQLEPQMKGFFHPDNALKNSKVGTPAEKNMKGPQDLWTTLRTLRTDTGQRFVPNEVGLGRVDLLTVNGKEDIIITSIGAVYGQLTPKKNAVRIFLEPKLELREWECIRATARMPDGEVRNVPVVIKKRNADESMILSLPRPKREGDRAHIEITCDVTASHTLQLPVADIHTAERLKPETIPVLYHGISKKPDDDGRYELRLSCLSYGQDRIPWNQIRCVVRSKESEKHLSFVHGLNTIEATHQSFAGGVPHSVTLYTAHRIRISTRVTLSFPDVPLEMTGPR